MKTSSKIFVLVSIFAMSSLQAISFGDIFKPKEQEYRLEAGRDGALKIERKKPSLFSLFSKNKK